MIIEYYLMTCYGRYYNNIFIICRYSTPKKTVTISTPDQQITPVKSYGKDFCTPTKSLLASIEIQQAEMASVTRQPHLQLIAELYSGCISSKTHGCFLLDKFSEKYFSTTDNINTIIMLKLFIYLLENLAPNLTVEMYFLTQLLTARGGDTESSLEIGQGIHSLVTGIRSYLFYAILYCIVTFNNTFVIFQTLMRCSTFAVYIMLCTLLSLFFRNRKSK